ncbi:energy-coupling factor transporter transmembrane protein EcfT [Candidatus Heimdallarchaeota archaeon]|nr:MAG: energy-coupling factor transporter transmembrane protein EcfT [Candidatus Heimdallarchaeota archaeon]
MTFRLLEYFDFERKKSLLHNLDPRGKLLFVITASCLVIYLNDLIPQLLALLFFIPFVFLGGFFKRWFLSLIYLMPFLIIITILNALLLSTSQPTTIALIIIVRLIILMIIFGLFFQTVSPQDLSQMFVKLKLPYSLAWAISTAYRFLPTLAKETEIITDAQKARGLQIDRGNIFKRIKNFLPLLIPIFASALRRSWQLAEAIESRGWNATKKRTYLYTLKMNWWDYLFVIFSLGIFSLFLFLIIQKPNFPEWMIWYIPEKFEIKRLLTIFWHWLVNLFA